ncbi:MAG: orotidine-5'-phosphate decarboxylase [Candidatus Omnitrophica bacterium]|nr:orotidine-5'-phosphate decarboxylase [Candidatus Omnitrophota bacterium]
MTRDTLYAINNTNLIVALDVDTFDRARYFVDKLYPSVGIFKVGFQLFTAAGPRVIEYIRNKGAEVFLDLKFYDIPNTVACAVRQSVRLDIRMITVHISGGKEMVSAAAQAARTEAKLLRRRRPLLIGVTVLTSRETSPADVLKLAREGMASGLDGVVCSAREVRLLRKTIKKKFIIVTPGIRPKTSPHDDQKRTATAEEALNAGSDYLVVGRPILEAGDPLKAVENIL